MSRSSPWGYACLVCSGAAGPRWHAHMRKRDNRTPHRQTRRNVSLKVSLLIALLRRSDHSSLSLPVDGRLVIELVAEPDQARPSHGEG